MRTRTTPWPIWIVNFLTPSPSLGHHLLLVFLPRSDAEMLRIDAPWMIARVAHEQTFRNRSYEQDVCSALRMLEAISHPKRAVLRSILCGYPTPAVAVSMTPFDEFTHKAFAKFLSRRSPSHPRMTVKFQMPLSV